MLIRAMIVLLAIFNLGVAVWWIARPDSLPPPSTALPEDVPMLQLVVDGPDAASVLSDQKDVEEAVTDDATDETPPGETMASASPGQCFSLGPVVDRAGADNLQVLLGARASVTRIRESRTASTGGYRVWIPPSSSRDEAQALEQRISAAGFDDYLLVTNGEDANSIALGMFRSRDSAERRQAALRTAGFEAEMRPSDEVPARLWLDVRAAEGFDVGQARALPGVSGVVALDCGDLR